MSEVTGHRAAVVWDGDKSDLRAHTIQLAGQTLPAAARRCPLCTTQLGQLR